MTRSTPPTGTQEELLGRYDHALLGVFGRPGRVLVRGEGCEVWDADGNRYLDLLAGIAVNALGHAHPDLVAALREQVGEFVHVSNFFTTVPQIALAERLLDVAGAPEGSAVFFTNSGTESIEAAVKLARRTGRPRILAAEGAFHGRSTGALALTARAAYREPFEPLLPGVGRVPFGDVDALERALSGTAGESVSALVLEPIQGESGVVPADVEYLRRARDLTSAAGVLLVLDEIQTGIGRTGAWFAFQRAGIVPDAITLAKGLAGGVPIGALVTFGSQVTGLLRKGDHGTTFGGNPLACRAGLTVLDVVERDGLVDHAGEMEREFRSRVQALGDDRLTEVRGAGLLLGLGLAEGIVAADVAAAALEAGYVVNAARPDTIRLAPPLVVTAEQLGRFVDDLPRLLDTAARREG
ncbi:acetylornithine transaminase [Mobilicoccus pelagius]|uniref:Acetylornithine aminotransferase n=1 Tax=Mobilicoccus pelagius NBRC 104925 TaxID=1089455 RepID=H5UPH8_9MICO|nr:acetylornithine transaminase [Mobilicoccus pelagius]GAB47636.1 acetylornithine aminotransferase [Mobilicoccus pelagius NBRC 104925]